MSRSAAIARRSPARPPDARQRGKVCEAVADLLASYFTLAGDVHPFQGAPVSPIALRDRIEAAGKAGFRGFGFAREDLQHSLVRWSFADIAGMLADNGLRWIEIELLRGWFGPNGDAVAAERRFLLQAAEALGARHIKIAGSGPDLDDMSIAGNFAALCDDAAQAGTAIVLELSPIGCIRTLERGRAIVEAAGRDNGGLLLDIWHVVRSGIDIGAITQLPAGLVHYAEICDGAAAGEGDYIEDTVDRRRPCGDGAFPIESFFSALEAAGYRGPIGVEILSHRQRELALRDAAAVAFDGAARCVGDRP